MILVDTDIIIDCLRGNDRGIRFLEERKKQAHLSVITKAEVLAGARNKQEQQKLHSFLTQFAILPLSTVTGEKAIYLIATYRLRIGLGILDAIIAATALERNIPLYTRNNKHFSTIAEIECFRPYTYT